MRRLYHLAGHLSTKVSNVAGHPSLQLATLLACIFWYVLDWSVELLGSFMTIGGFILTQMVLNQQRRRENALHLKIDEMILAMQGTRNELAGVEQATEEEIEELRSGHDAH